MIENDLSRGVITQVNQSIKLYISNTSKITIAISAIARKINWIGKYIPLPNAVNNYRLAMKMEEATKNNLDELNDDLNDGASIISNLQETLESAYQSSSTAGNEHVGIKDADYTMLRKKHKTKQLLKEIIDKAIEDIEQKSQKITKFIPGD